MIVKLHDGTEGEGPTAFDATTALLRLLTGAHGPASTSERGGAVAPSVSRQPDRFAQHSWGYGSFAHIGPRVTGHCINCGAVRRARDKPGQGHIQREYRRIQLVYEYPDGRVVVTSASGKVPRCGSGEDAAP